MSKKARQRKKVIIGIHGLGNKVPEKLLEKWWLLSIKEGLERLNIQTNHLPEFRMVYWADVMYDKPLDPFISDYKNPYCEDEPYAPGTGTAMQEPHPVRKKILDFVNDQLDKVFLNKDLSINYSEITDTFIRKYFFELDAYFSNSFEDSNGKPVVVKEILCQRLLDAIEFYREYDITLIAHSMGTIIAYEVLSTLPADIKVDSFITIGSPLGLPVIKSRIVAGLKEYLPGKVLLNVPEAVQKFWFNLTDIEDNIALNYKLSDDFVPNQAGAGITDVQVVNDYIFNNHKNPHKAYGYLRTPEMAEIINNFNQMNSESRMQRIIRTITHVIK